MDQTTARDGCCCHHRRRRPVGGDLAAAQLVLLRYFSLDGTYHADHKEQGGMSRNYLIW
ncbi:hypothetical protein ACIA74_26830 [Streptomyces sp. NPDC051658]|uniref:hypothetical protein n=1 Tax=Streptomyces sp. NPDC051658 TaxID=3365667 RepID=UPI0037B9C2C5